MGHAESSFDYSNKDYTLCYYLCIVDSHLKVLIVSYQSDLQVVFLLN